MSDISKPYTKYDQESKRKFEEGWERIFGKKEEEGEEEEVNSSGSSVGRASVL